MARVDRRDTALFVLIVIDAATALAAVLPDTHSSYADAAIAIGLRDGIVVPALWPYEIQNALLAAVRRERLDAGMQAKALEELATLGAEFVSPEGLGTELRIARAHGTTAYDAAYIAVALSRGAALATRDRRLIAVAEKLGITIFMTA